MTTAESLDPHWQTFRSQPAAFAHADRIVRVFGGVVGRDVAAKLAEEERFRERLSGLLTAVYALSDDFGDEAPSAASRRLALASETELAAWIRRFGAVYWARAIAGTIEASVVVALKQTLDDDAYAAALAHRDLSGPDRMLPAPEGLGADVTAAGLRCLAAWCARQPAGIAQRIRLKLPADAELDNPVIPPFEQAGPRIVDRLVT
jgi:hypothetical protein